MGDARAVGDWGAGAAEPQVTRVPATPAVPMRIGSERASTVRPACARAGSAREGRAAARAPVLPISVAHPAAFVGARWPAGARWPGRGGRGAVAGARWQRARFGQDARGGA
jgi:hypothetical protein